MHQWKSEFVKSLTNAVDRANRQATQRIEQAMVGLMAEGMIVFPVPELVPEARCRLAVEIAETIMDSEHADDELRQYAEGWLAGIEEYLWVDELDDGDEVATGDFTGGGVAEALDKMFDPDGADGITVAEWQRQYLGDWVPEEDGPAPDKDGT